MKNSAIAVIILSFGILFSCKTTKIASSWKQPDKQIDIQSLKKVLVVAMLKSENARRKAEDEMVKFLDGKGVPSYSYLKDSFNRKDEQALRAKIKGDGFDGAITMTLMDVERERIYTLSYVGIYPGNPISFTNYYYRHWPGDIRDGYYLTTKIFTVEVAIFSILEDQIIWTSETKTVNPDGVDKMTNEIAKVLQKRMIKEGFISKK
ncbi:hypothetical protein EGI22_12200 [Lacihabitans sp. LS3-19]|uniref:hypothetical protein n=1 Tax=Lacihabitans sp. LS3-19 TaxID=2487335 RepID=UPI0020CB7430|nr:hypothetical protein [Lacihabitans sp. LS3-19]MCP9768679.1 hypothetical protein [Lacihabitans sp. LS3-19]